MDVYAPGRMSRVSTVICIHLIFLVAFPGRQHLNGAYPPDGAFFLMLIYLLSCLVQLQFGAKHNFPDGWGGVRRILLIPKRG